MTGCAAEYQKQTHGFCHLVTSLESKHWGHRASSLCLHQATQHLLLLNQWHTGQWYLVMCIELVIILSEL
jgi:hypothetical protein